MKLVPGLFLCVLCGWCTMVAQVIPTSIGSCRMLSSAKVSREMLPATRGAANENTSRPDGVEVGKQIDETERALYAMKRPLNAQEQKTSTLIHSYIRHAREALQNDDLDGASVLSKKARVLLLELCKECRRQNAKLMPYVA